MQEKGGNGTESKLKQMNTTVFKMNSKTTLRGKEETLK